MRHFDKIVLLAVKRCGSDALKRSLDETRPLSPSDIAATPDNRILAAMTRCVFRAGFSSAVIDGKWAAFEDAFDGFDPARCARISERRYDDLLRNEDIVRNGAKIRSVIENAQFVEGCAQEHGSAARFFAQWPNDDYVSLLDLLKKRASRLGGETGMRFLRAVGKPAFIPTPDVIKALIREGVLAKAPSGKGDFQAIQKAFNRWGEQSGLDLTSMSRMLAFSVDS